MTSNSLLLYFHILFLLLFRTANGQDISPNAINLVGWEGCTSSMVNKIKVAWEDAVRLGQDIRDKHIDWDAAVTVDFLGPPGFNIEVQDQMRAVLESPADFGQGSWWFHPPALKWRMYVRCDDWKKYCTREPAGAYTLNLKGSVNGDRPKGNWDRVNADVTVINFCPAFFRMKSLSEIIAANKAIHPDDQLDMSRYRANTAYVVYHEMMHSDLMTWEKNKKGHIYDLIFQLGPSKTTRNIYGAMFCKTLARWYHEEAPHRVGEKVAENADSLAQYALARKVQDAIGRYPHMPLADRRLIQGIPEAPYGQLSLVDDNNGQLSWGQNLSTFADVPPIEELVVCDDSDDDSCNDEPVNLDGQSLNAIPDDKYPPAYIEQRKAWISAAATMTLRPLTEPTPLVQANENQDSSFYCAYSEVFSKSLPSVEQPFAQNSIKDACKKFDGITMDSDKQSTLILPYVVGEQSGAKSDNVLWLGAGWNIGDPRCARSRAITADECNQMLSNVLNDCDTSSVSFKYGGWKVNDCVVWTIGIKGTPRNNPQAPGNCGRLFCLDPGS